MSHQFAIVRDEFYANLVIFLYKLNLTARMRKLTLDIQFCHPTHTCQQVPCCSSSKRILVSIRHCVQLSHLYSLVKPVFILSLAIWKNIGQLFCRISHNLVLFNVSYWLDLIHAFLAEILQQWFLFLSLRPIRQ
jgi:hypothetical protein